jgi:hypothetical protein
MTILNLINTVAIVICATACGQAPATSATSLEATNIAPSADPISQPVSSPNPVASPVSVTYYSLTTSPAPVNGYSFDHVTLTGSCVVYDSNTYCWDNGAQEISVTANHTTTNYFYTYWAMGKANSLSNYGPCYGGCTIDVMSAPTMIDQGLGTNIATSVQDNYGTQSTINQVLTTGTPSTVTCTDDAGVLTCGQFVIDTTQVGL